MFSKIAIIALAPLALAANHAVAVGQNNGLTFTPQSITAQPGDTVTYTYMTQNHTVTSANFGTACAPSTPLQFNSGFVPANQGTNGKQPSFTVNVANTNPISVYCGQAQHCQNGMVMVINPAASGAQSLVQVQRLASQAKTNTPAQGGPTGGQLANFNANAGAATGKANAGAATGNANKGSNANAGAATAGAAGNATGAGKQGGKKNNKVRMVFEA